MKNYILVLCLLFTLHNSRANHIEGGEITWDCLEQGVEMGKLVFKVKLWSACYAGAASMPTNISISNPLYTLYGGVSTITCLRVSSTDISPPCYDVNNTIKCQLIGPLGYVALEEHMYISAPVQINGIPAVTGSAFSFSTCCRPTAINTYGTQLYLRSVMYPYTDVLTNTVKSLGSTSSGPTCYDSSPIFTEKLPYIQIQNKKNYFSLNAIDTDCDSLNYEKAIPMINATTAITWLPGYSHIWPMGQNPSNIPFIINAKTGSAHHQTFNMTGLYEMCQKVTSYKNQQRVSEVFRDYIMVMDSGASNSYSSANSAPVITFKNAGPGIYSSSYSDTVFVGDSVHINIKAVDNDLNAANTNQIIKLRILPNSALDQLFNPWGCVYSSCATLDTNSMHWFGNAFYGYQSVFADFKWKTNCEHLIQCGNLTDNQREFKTYTFSIEAIDDNCTVPMRIISEFSITLRDTSIIEPKLTSINYTDTLAHITWKKQVGSTFQSYNVFKSDNANGPYILLDSITNVLDTTYTDSLGLSNGTYHYYKVISSGHISCFEKGNTARSIVLNVFDSSGYHSSLSWNSMIYVWNPVIFGYYLIEADTGNGWFQLDSIWGLLSTNYTDVTNACKSSIDYRILGFDLTNNINYISNVDSARYTFPQYYDTLFLCSPDSILLGGQYRKNSGIYTNHLQTYQGCDSTVQVNLTVDSAVTHTVNYTICQGDRIFLYGQYRTTSETFHFTYPGPRCDSLVTVNLEVKDVDTSVTSDKRSLTSNANNALYNWISCPTNSLLGIQTKTYTPTSNGNYAVVVTQNGCTDTSVCYSIQTVGVRAYEAENNFLVYPNPADNSIKFELKNGLSSEHGKLELYNAQGNLYLSQDYLMPFVLNTVALPEGIYFYKLTNKKSQSHSGRIVISH